MIKNSQGSVWYGLHFYPGLAEYKEADTPYRVFLNEDTIRKMDPTFAAKPVFVQHVNEVSPNLDQVKVEADGWVVESFFNAADGKHWCKFIIVSERGEKAIKDGMRLSNAYYPKNFAPGGTWNGMAYDKEITDAEYEHLAIVANPRYEESKILSPEEFKRYNSEKLLELKKLSNEGDKGKKMKFNFFKRSKVENEVDPSVLVTLPKTGKEISLADLITNADEAEEKKKDMHQGLADSDHKVKMSDGSYCNVGELVEKYGAMKDEMEAMKKANEDKAKEEEEKKNSEDKDKDEPKKNDDKEEDKKDEKKANSSDLDKELAKKKANDLREAHINPLLQNQEKTVDLPMDQVARGKARYGSG